MSQLVLVKYLRETSGCSLGAAIAATKLYCSQDEALAFVRGYLAGQADNRSIVLDGMQREIDALQNRLNGMRNNG